MEDNKIKNEFGNFAEKPQVPKKLYDFKYIALGLLIFFGLVFSPILPNLGKTVAAPDPKLDTPAIQKLAEKDRKCVMPKDFMRASHMQMLVDWREAVVRDGQREFVNPEGKKFTASLSNTCMECHTNKTKFCDQCHNYVAVTPNCWGCHLDKEQKVAKAEAK
jgi:hypothetical protein